MLREAIYPRRHLFIRKRGSGRSPYYSSTKGETATGGGPSVKIGDQSDPIDTVVIANLYQAISDFFLLTNASSFLGGKIFAT